MVIHIHQFTLPYTMINSSHGNAFDDMFLACSRTFHVFFSHYSVVAWCPALRSLAVGSKDVKQDALSRPPFFSKQHVV